MNGEVAHWNLDSSGNDFMDIGVSCQFLTVLDRPSTDLRSSLLEIQRKCIPFGIFGNISKGYVN